MYVRMCAITNLFWPEQRVICNHVPGSRKGKPPHMTEFHVSHVAKGILGQ